MTNVEKEIREKIATLDKSIEYLELVREVMYEKLDKEMEKNDKNNNICKARVRKRIKK